MLLSLNFSPMMIFMQFLAAGIAYIILKFYLIPYFKILFYKKQGAATRWNWKLVSFPDDCENAIKRGDFNYGLKEVVRKNPTAKFIAQNSGPWDSLILTDPQMIKEFLQKIDVYQKDDRIFGLIMDLFKNSMVFSEDASWKKRRKIISTAFNFEFLKNTVPIIIDTVQERFQEWTSSSGNLTNMRLTDQIGMITGDVAGAFLFGKKFGKLKLGDQPITVGLQNLFNEIFMEAFSPSTAIFGPRLIKSNILPRHRAMNRNIKELWSQCQSIVEEAKQGEMKENNLLNSLLKLRAKNDPETNLSDQDIIDEFIVFFTAGTDTTANLVASAVYFLWKYPQYREKVKQEVVRYMTDLSSLDIEKVNSMEYTTAVLKETLRLGGPAITLAQRVCVKDDELCGVKIKKGTQVNIIQDLHYTSENYFTNAKEFNPERWLKSAEEIKEGFKKEPYSYVPFSGGPRNCIGQHFAMIEARIIIGMLVKSFDWSFPEDYEFKLTQRLTFQPIDPLLITLTPKSSVL